MSQSEPEPVSPANSTDQNKDGSQIQFLFAIVEYTAQPGWSSCFTCTLDLDNLPLILSSRGVLIVPEILSCQLFTRLSNIETCVAGQH